MAEEKSISISFNKVSVDADSKKKEKLISLVFDKKRNIFLSGPGGVGKTYNIKNYIQPEAIKRGKILHITSTTGVSALSIGGTTIHRWAGIKIGKESAITIFNRLKLYNRECCKRWEETDVLVIDEISMLGAKIFELLDKVGQLLCDNTLPFGGKSLIVSGDFLQLPPVNDSFVFTSSVWDEMNFRVVRLTEPKRYPDLSHFELLMRVRMARHTKEDVKTLYKRVEAYIDYIRKGGDKNEKIKPTKLFSLKKDVAQHNLDELAKLDGETVIYNAVDKFITKSELKNMEKESVSDRMIKKNNKDKISGKDIMEYTEFLDTVIDRQIYLKPGAQVILTYNLSVELGLLNGSRGVALHCDPDGVLVLFKNGVTMRILLNAYEFEDGNVKLIRYQIPLILAWAISIHKSQSLTLDYVIMDLGPSLFAPGMAYVALSRVRTLDGLLLSSFAPNKITADPEAVRFEQTIIDEEKNEDEEEDDVKDEGEENKEGEKGDDGEEEDEGREEGEKGDEDSDEPGSN